MEREKMIKDEDYWQVPKSLIPLISATRELKVCVLNPPEDPIIYIGAIEKWMAEAEKAILFLGSLPPQTETIDRGPYFSVYAVNPISLSFNLAKWHGRFENRVYQIQRLSETNQYDDWRRILLNNIDNPEVSTLCGEASIIHNKHIERLFPRFLNGLIEGVIFWDREAGKLYKSITGRPQLLRLGSEEGTFTEVEP